MSNNKRKIAIRKAATIKTGYSNTNISSTFRKHKKDIGNFQKDRRYVNKNNIAKVIEKAELYHKIYKDLERIVSRIDETNGQRCITKIDAVIDDVIKKNLPDPVRNQIVGIKKKLEELGKLADIDIYKAKDKVIVVAKNRIYNHILDQAARIHKNTFFSAGQSYIKKPLTHGEIADWIRNKDSAKRLKSFTDKLTSASYVINNVDKVIKRTGKVVKVLDSYAEGIDLLNQSNNLTTPKHYKDYYYKVAQEASKMASVFKSLSSKLPRGMREYYEFIFTIAENTDKMAKVVYDYTGRLEKAIAELDKDSKSRGEKNSHFNDGGVPGDVTKYPNDHSNSYLQ